MQAEISPVPSYYRDQVHNQCLSPKHFQSCSQAVFLIQWPLSFSSSFLLTALSRDICSPVHKASDCVVGCLEGGKAGGAKHCKSAVGLGQR